MSWMRGPVGWLASKKRTRRRGLMLLASTVAAGGLSRVAGSQEPDIAHAANGDPVRAGMTTTATATTQLNLTAGAYAAFVAQAQPAAGPAIGINGISSNGSGVVGTSTGGVGVFGTTTNAAGVFGQSTNAPGVSGFSSNNVGLQGSSSVSNGVLGTTNSNVGVFGDATGAGTGTVGRSDSGTGVFAQSRAGTAIVGRSTNAVGILGQTSNPGSLAGQFEGSVLVNGSLTVMGIKSAAVPGPDGELVRYYCTEATEAWFEDHGEARLSGGSVTVPLDDDFMATVTGANYNVYLTPYGPSNGLYVTNRTAKSFDVVEQGNGNGNISFCYRIVAKRKDFGPSLLERNVRAARLEKVARPPKQEALEKEMKPGIEEQDLPKPPKLPQRDRP